MQADMRARRQVIEQRRGLVEKQRQVVFDAGGQEPPADILVKPAPGWIALEFFPETDAERGERRIVRWAFPRRPQPQLADFLNAAPWLDVEGAEAPYSGTD